MAILGRWLSVPTLIQVSWHQPLPALAAPAAYPLLSELPPFRHHVRPPPTHPTSCSVCRWIPIPVGYSCSPPEKCELGAAGREYPSELAARDGQELGAGGWGLVRHVVEQREPEGDEADGQREAEMGTWVIQEQKTKG